MLNAFTPENDSSRREVRTADEFAEVDYRGIRMLDEMDNRIHDFIEVVWGYVGSHADGDAGLPIEQQIRQLCRKDNRLPLRAIVVVHPIDGVLVDVGQQLLRDGRHPALRVPHSGGRVGVDRTEVALSVDE